MNDLDKDLLEAMQVKSEIEKELRSIQIEGQKLQARQADTNSRYERNLGIIAYLEEKIKGKE